MADNVAIINATDLSPVLENTQTKTHKERVNTSGQEGGAATTEVKLTVAQLPSTTGIETMIQSGQVGRSGGWGRGSVGEVEMGRELWMIGRKVTSTSTCP